jgi:YfiH family protein
MPSLSSRTIDGITVLTDDDLRAESGVLVAFTERTGGCSSAPFGTLNLAAHVGDDAGCVDRNRTSLLNSLGIGDFRDRVTTAQQIHGRTIADVGEAQVGAGASAGPGTAPPIAGADGLVTLLQDVPLLLLFADCVPVVLVAAAPRRAIAVVHAGWRGALAGIAAEGARTLAASAGCEASELTAYVGPHIGACHYEVDETLLSQFVHTFGTIAAAQGRLDLGAVVSESLNGVGVPISSVCRAGLCTAERTDAFFSYRAEGLTGRHGALACILGNPR